MGVDYNNCSGCGNIFPDVMGYSWCICGAYYCESCEEAQVKKYKADEGELQMCDACDPMHVEEKELKELKRLKKKYSKGHSYDSQNRREFICPKCTWDETLVRYAFDAKDKETLYCTCKRCDHTFREEVEYVNSNR